MVLLLLGSLTSLLRMKDYGAVVGWTVKTLVVLSVTI
jgi:hypothetical protein